MSNASNHSSEDARASEGRGRKGGADLQNWGNGYQDPAGSSQSSLYDRHPPTHASSSRRDGRSNAPGHVGDTTTPKVNAARRTRQRTESQPAAFDGHARHRANGDTTPGPQKTSRDEEQFNFAVDARTNGQGVGATYQSQISPYATMTVGRFHIKNEEPPFDPNSVPSSSHSHAASEDDEAPPRASVESEERPFEHWYRGEVSRNGGVGELRVGRRKEMLDIANYGYTAKKNASRTPSAVDNGGRDPARRRRADSVAGIGERESVYMDEERARQLGLVMDEHPPTDIEGDSEQEQPYTWNARSQGYYQEPTPTRDQFSRPSLNDRANSPSNIGLPPTRIPAPASPRAGTPPQRRGALEPVPDPSTPKASRPFSPPQETPKASESANKRRRGTTPPVASASKKAKGKSPARTIQKTQDRGSVAYYPTPNGDNMEDAIPTWSQPVQGGNWDEVSAPTTLVYGCLRVLNIVNRWSRQPWLGREVLMACTRPVMADHSPLLGRTKLHLPLVHLASIIRNTNLHAKMARTYQ